MACDNTEQRSIQIIQNEITTLITSMRKVSTSRWGTSSTVRSIDEEPDDFLKSLYSLRMAVNSLPNLYELDCCTLLAPFIGIIKDESVSGYITGLALLSLNKFIIYDIISVDSKGNNHMLYMVFSLIVRFSTCPDSFISKYSNSQCSQIVHLGLSPHI